MSTSSEHQLTLLREQIAELLKINQDLRLKIERQQATIDRLTKVKFGRKSERIEGPTLFDAFLDQAPAPADVINLTPEEPIALVPKKKKHGRKKNAPDLPRRREEIVLSAAEIACPCCQAERVKVGEKIRERLDYIPSSLFVVEIAHPTYLCRHCEQSGLDPQFVKPNYPPEPIPKSGINPGLLAEIIVHKYIDHLPLHRQVSIFARQGWPVARSRLCDLVLDCGKLLEPLYFKLTEQVLQSFILHADETPVTLLLPRRTAYAWQYLGDADHPYTVYDFATGRGSEHPLKFLQGYPGYLQSDGYSGYNDIHGKEKHIGCWAHARRKFVEAQSSDPAQASHALAYIRTLYAVEREIIEKKLTGDAVVSLRQSRAGPILKRFGEWIENQVRETLPKSPLGQAFGYVRNQWASLNRYLTDARFAIDNNVAERAIRPLAVGRKNWLFIGGDAGLSTASVLMSICASAKQHGLNPWAYLKDIISRLANGDTDLTSMLPDIWAKNHCK